MISGASGSGPFISISRPICPPNCSSTSVSVGMPPGCASGLALHSTWTSRSWSSVYAKIGPRPVVTSSR